MSEQHVAAWTAQTEYACEYSHNGVKWALNFHAVDDADAALRLLSIKASLVMLGSIELTIPWGVE